ILKSIMPAIADLICKACDEPYTDLAAFLTHSVSCCQPSGPNSQIFVCSICSLFTNKVFIVQKHCQAAHNGQGTMQLHLRFGGQDAAGASAQQPPSQQPAQKPPTPPNVETDASEPPPAAGRASGDRKRCQVDLTTATAAPSAAEPPARRVKTEPASCAVKAEPLEPASTAAPVNEEASEDTKAPPAIIAPGFGRASGGGWGRGRGASRMRSGSARRGAGRRSSASTDEPSGEAAPAPVRAPPVRSSARQASRSASERISSSVQRRDSEDSDEAEEPQQPELADSDEDPEAAVDIDFLNESVAESSAESGAESGDEDLAEDSASLASSPGSDSPPGDPSNANSTAAAAARAASVASEALCQPISVVAIRLAGSAISPAAGAEVSVQLFADCIRLSVGPNRCLILPHPLPEIVAYCARHASLLIRFYTEDFQRARESLGFSMPTPADQSRCRLCLQLERPLPPAVLASIRRAYKAARTRGALAGKEFSLRQLLLLKPKWGKRILDEANGWHVDE
ncbi:hypothetical protein BOX15_Mlig015669g1, partial [Macrostomum lignano]